MMDLWGLQQTGEDPVGQKEGTLASTGDYRSGFELYFGISRKKRALPKAALSLLPHILGS